MEMFFKIVLSAVLVTLLLIGLRWVWTNHIDLGATIEKASEKVVAPPDWIATRDPQKIYQEGKPVGDISGPINKNEENYLFSQIINTSNLDIQKPFEYQRSTFMVKKIGTTIGMKSDGRKMLTSVLENVDCQKLN